ncbi:hypothetical protein FJV41_20095 [Myxococcus llanfairpwllgwyngyllgogerychwyrndrobwllllantysiliogogogochensis]|uniref:Uncharacterized protein n=1 Tax=Myxococcus llanfairpwllgwyngyllgogerychwyrndrobwllllantysiliogogogochensis TaxID=2590453 RepID=A0A540WYV2_9BACT|nr:hypothetical protein [Myxococcus llanfairpwllgwyngyllgogerychwyrndrobwllllantysiliogogogochensis]TQF14189.1 hypothetical protein FJV41_20095 [Myxococcus llanfairpwllgwyngyllgogerychwyrndrobwllllantysiliogogogochensis]
MHITLEPTGFDGHYRLPRDGEPPAAAAFFPTARTLLWRARSSFDEHVRLSTGEWLKDLTGTVCIEIGQSIEMEGKRCGGLIRAFSPRGEGERTFHVDLRVSPDAFERLLGPAYVGRLPIIAIVMDEGAAMQHTLAEGIKWDNAQHGWVEVVWWDFWFKLTQASDAEIDASKSLPTATQADAVQQQLGLLARQLGCLLWLGGSGVTLLGILLWTLRG